jgi:hypothetical protein
MGPVQRANLSHWTTFVSITTTVEVSDNRFRKWEIRGKYTIKIMIKHADT